MPKKATFYMTKLKGKLEFLNPSLTLYKKFVAKLKDGVTLKMELNEEKSSKTLEQLGYYYAVIIPMAIEALIERGNDSIAESQLFGYPVTLRPNKFHVDIMLKALYGVSNAEFNVSKTTMTTDEMSDFLEFVMRFMAENWGVFVPPPRK